MNKNLTVILTLILVTWVKLVCCRGVRCGTIKLANGRSKLLRDGSVVKLRCLKGYELVGRRYMNCFRSQWDFQRDPSVPFPMCVKPGCRASPYVNGHFLETYKGAVVNVVCDLGYTLVGPATVYCNGSKWNQPFPECKAFNSAPLKACTFEDNLCGWTQDQDGDWIWRKKEDFQILEPIFEKENAFQPPYSGGSNFGSYMFLGNSSSKVMNATERLFSPVFPAEYSKNSCFSFWYSIHGRTSGYLKVFVKPEGGELYNSIPLFWVTGMRSASWLPGYFRLEEVHVPFQIIFEGRSLAGNESFTAFDDVAIRTGEECQLFREQSYFPFTSTEPSEDDDDGATCKDRCGSSDESYKCTCHESCVSQQSCCLDYFKLCPADAFTTEPFADVDAKGADDDAASWRTTNSAVISESATAAVNGSHGDDSRKEEPGKTSTTGATAERTTSTTPTPRRRSNQMSIQFHMDPSMVIRKSFRQSAHEGGGASPQTVVSEGEGSAKASFGLPPGAMESVAAVAAVLACAGIAVALIRRRRRRKSEKESMVEDSDVRFLTEDEFLDFTLARPADDDL